MDYGLVDLCLWRGGDGVVGRRWGCFVMVQVGRCVVLDGRTVKAVFGSKYGHQKWKLQVSLSFQEPQQQNLTISSTLIFLLLAFNFQIIILS